MTLIEQNLEMYKGDTKNLVVSVFNTDGSVKNLTDATIIWALFNSDTKEIYVTKTTGSGIIITNPTGGIIQISILPTDTETLKSGPWYKYETEVTDSGSNVSTVNSGYFTLWESVI